MAASRGTPDSPKTMKRKRTQRKITTSEDEHGIDNVAEGPKEKRVKKEYTDIDFKGELRDKNTIFTALGQFVEEATRYPLLGSYDIVENYCKSSAECIEIFKLLEGEKRNSTELSAIFSVLEVILVGIADRLPRLHAIAKAIVQRILANHLGLIYFVLQSRHKSNQIKAALKLMSAMVMQGGTSPHEVCSRFAFQNPVLQPLFNRRDSKDSKDVRACLLHFLMSFLTVGDIHVIRQIIEVKGLLSSIFTGMNVDHISTLQMVLPTLKEKVVQNPELSKTIKVKLFNSATLTELVKLYGWKGPVKWSDMKKGLKKNKQEDVPMVEDEGAELDPSEKEARSTVTDMAHQLLLSVCCDFKLGVNFYDKVLGTSGKSQNHIMTTVLTSLPQPYLSTLMSELVVRVLMACPDQLTWYLPTLKHSLTPRPSHNWLAAVTLLRKIYEAQPAASPVMKLSEHHPTSKLVAMAMATLVPPRDVWAAILEAVRHKSPVVQHEGLGVILLVLRRVAATLDIFSESSAEYSPEEVQAFTTRLRDSIAKVCPEVPNLLQCWSRAVRSEEKEGSANESKQGDDKDVDLDTDTVVTKGLPVVSQVDHLLRVLQVICEYQAILPEVFREHIVNFGALLEGVRSIATNDDTPEDRGSLLQLYMLRLLAESNVRQLSWMKENIGGRSTLYLLLEMVVITKNNAKMLSVAVNLLRKLFVSTGLFDHTEGELPIWLKELASLAPGDEQSMVLTFLEKVFTTVLKDPYSLMEKVAEAVSEAASVENGKSIEADSAVTSSDQLIDAILSMDAVPLDDTTDKPSTNTGHIDDTKSRFPFSALVPAALVVLKDLQVQAKDVPECVKTYVSDSLAAVLMVQEDPVPLCLMLHQQGAVSELPSLEPYLHIWLPLSKQTAVMSPPSPKKLRKLPTLREQLSVAFLGGVDYLATNKVQKKLLESAEQINLEEAERDVQQILLFARTYAHTNLKDERNVEVFKFYLALLGELLASVAGSTSLSEVETSSIRNLGSEFASIEVAKPRKCDILVRLYSLVLNHSDLENWFLWKPSFDLKKKIAKREMMLRKIVTPRLAEMICVIPPDVAFKLTAILERYKQKVAEELSVYIQDLGAGTEDNKDEVLQAMKFFIQLFDWDEVLSIAQMLATLSSKLVVKKGVVTKHGHALLCILTRVVDSMESDRFKALNLLNTLPLGSVSLLVKLETKNTVPGMQELMLRFLQVCPIYALATSQTYLQQCLQLPPGGPGLEIAVLLVSHSKACRDWFEEFWFGPGEQTQSKWHYLDVVLQYALSLSTEEKTNKKLLELHKTYWNDLKTWIRTLPEEEKKTSNSKFALLILLTEICSDTDILQASWSEMLVHFTGATRVSMYQVVYIHALSKALQLADTDGQLPVWDVYIATGLKVLTNILTSKEKSWENNVITLLIDHVQEALEEPREDVGSLTEVILPIWNQFVKAGLKCLYTNVQFLKLLSTLIGVVYPSSAETVLPTTTVYEMLTSHSRFIGTMLENEDELKDVLVNLLLIIARRDTTACTSAHLAVFFGAYKAMLNRTDQNLLLLLQLYEANGCSMSDYSPFLWGPKAIEHYSLKKSIRASLWTHPSCEQVIENLDVDKLETSILNFPLQRVLRPSSVVAADQMTSTPEAYDPCFLLPLLGHLLTPGKVVNCKQFVEIGCLSYVLTALSSHDEQMRGAAYHVLSEFYHKVEESKFPGCEQVQYLLELVKNSITTKNGKLVPIVTTFLARAARLVLAPGTDMYEVVNEFLLLKPAMDTWNVPEFFKLFNSSHLQYKIERVWMLSLLGDGMRETGDYRVYERRHAFKLLLSFHDAATSDRPTQLLVLRVVLQACRLRTVTSDLSKNHGLLSWLSGVVTSSSDDCEKQRLLVDIVGTMWTTMLAGRDDTMSTKIHKWPCLPPEFTNQVLHLLLTMLHSLRNMDDLDILLKFASCLSSVLFHLNKTLASTMVPVYVRIQAKDVIQLLGRWASLGEQHQFETEVKTLLERLHPQSDSGLRELVGTMSAKKIERKRQDVATSDPTDKPENPGLNEKLIGNILEIVAHWKPCVICDHEKAAGCQACAPCAAKVAAVLLVCEWSLNQVFTHFPQNVERFDKLLRWFKLWVNEQDVQKVLSTDSDTTGRVLGRILSICGHATKMVTCDVLKPECVVNITQVSVDLNKVACLTTDVLAQIIDFANAHQTDGSEQTRVQHTLSLPAFRSVLQAAAEKQVSPGSLCLFVQELWMKAKQPRHFQAIVGKSAQT